MAIRVRDTGLGIAERDRESIFQPFFRMDKSCSRAMGSVGLGRASAGDCSTTCGTVQTEQSAEKGRTRSRGMRVPFFLC